MKPICTKENPSPQLHDMDGYKIWNHTFKHPDCFVSVKSNNEAYFKKDKDGKDIVILVDGKDINFIQIYCPNCQERYGYNRNVFLSKGVPATFWKNGEFENNQKIHDGQYDI